MASNIANIFYKTSPSEQRKMLEGPAMPPPPGIMPNFSLPPSRRQFGWEITIICSTLSGLSVAIRMYSRIFYSRKVGIEDFLTVAALGAYVGFQYYAMSTAASPGWFVHTWEIPLKELSTFLHNVLCNSIVHGIVIMLLKAAILTDLLRIFNPRGQRNLFFWACHTLLWVNVVFYTICTFLEIYGCQPREKTWNPLIPGGRCINMHTLTLASGAINFPSDLCILLLPLRTIWGLHLSRRRKIGTSAVFAIATLACICAGARIVYSVPLLYDLDVVYKIAYVGAWVQVEIAAGFMILCFPTLPLLWKSSPMLKRVSNCINTWMRSYFRKRNLDSTRGLPSWYKSHILKSTPQEPDCAAWENIMDCAILMQDSGKELKGCDGGINRSVPCPMSIEEVPRARVRGDDSREIWKSVTYSVDLEGGETSDS